MYKKREVQESYINLLISNIILNIKLKKSKFGTEAAGSTIVRIIITLIILAIFFYLIIKVMGKGF